MIRRLLLASFIFAIPFAASAQDYITRRDGFLLLWHSIIRPVEEFRETAFEDVPEGDLGYTEITYAKNRGLLDDEEDGQTAFRPGDPLSVTDGLIWLFRLTNVEFPDDLTPDTLTGTLALYPIANVEDPIASDREYLTQDDLLQLMAAFKAMRDTEEHEVSLYSEKFHGKGTAFGETFNMHAMTAAHPTFPHNTLVRVTNVENDESVVVRVNDRGPYVHGRSMDLSLGAFTTIAERSKGVIQVTLERLGDARLLDQCNPDLRKYAKRLTRDIHFNRGLPHTISVGETLTLSANSSFVVQGITYPTGAYVRFQDFVLPGEQFSMTLGVEGEYILHVASPAGEQRDWAFQTLTCD